MTTSSGNFLKDISHAHFVFLKYELITSARGSDDLSLGFDRGRKRRQDELTSNKIMKGKYNMRIKLKDVFDFAERQQKTFFGHGL